VQEDILKKTKTTEVILKLKIMAVKFLNSWLWFNLYYRHTKKHKSDYTKTRDAVLKKRKEIIGR
jgi:hypothetical protein